FPFAFRSQSARGRSYTPQLSRKCNYKRNYDFDRPPFVVRKVNEDKLTGRTPGYLNRDYNYNYNKMYNSSYLYNDTRTKSRNSYFSRSNDLGYNYNYDSYKPSYYRVLL
ncbi:hypothetical protein A3Q56_08776, partial [Intoshia linei]